MSNENTTVWRIVWSPALPGPENMAVDEAILESVKQGLAPPTLRFYTWSPACVSIGYFQCAAASTDMAEIKRRGLGFVRRPTGGRAILHDDELTYSVVAPVSLLPGPSSVLDTYLTISRGLLSGLLALGAQVELAPRGGDRPGHAKSAACFDTPSSYELVSGGRKVVGSAQTRRGGVLLQHGSVPISMDFQLLTAVLGLEPRMKETLRSGVVTVSELLGRGIEPRELGEALAGGLIREVLGACERGELTGGEKALAAELVAKYNSDEWNFVR
ncbi:MAG: lipoate--protein ligase family protein [Firmicutes bacterium]|jgi:lipoate-protein ligase A|nr:lipoate--protein ligase family protein [Bacillota bacterium]